MEPLRVHERLHCSHLLTLETQPPLITFTTAAQTGWNVTNVSRNPAALTASNDRVAVRLDSVDLGCLVSNGIERAVFIRLETNTAEFTGLCHLIYGFVEICVWLGRHSRH